MDILLNKILLKSGGIELLFDNIKQKSVEIPSSINPPNSTTMKDLVCIHPIYTFTH